MNHILIGGIIIFIICFIIFFIYYLSKNNFENYNIINYIQDISTDIKENNTPSNLSDILLHNKQNIDNNLVPNEIKELGFSNCNAAIAYYKNNNINMFLPTPDNNIPLSKLCSEYIKGTDASKIQDLTDFNKNINNIVNEIDKNINSKYVSTNTDKIKSYMESRYPQLNSDPIFSIESNSINNINDYYTNKMADKIDNRNNLQNIIYGNFIIIPNQFILLNDLTIQILSDNIKFLMNDKIIFSYNFKYSYINSNHRLKLENIQKYNQEEVISMYDIDNIILFLSNLGFYSDKFVYITEVNTNTYAIKSSDFKTLFLIKKKITNTNQQIHLSVSI